MKTILNLFYILLYIVLVVQNDVLCGTFGDSLLTKNDSLILDVGFITVHSNPSGSDVYLDTIHFGKTPIDSVQVYPREYILKVFYPSSSHWYHTTISESIAVNSGEEIRRMFFLPRVTQFTTEPSGAYVNVKDSIIGITPCFVTIDRELPFVNLWKNCYESETISIIDSPQRIHIVLKSNYEDKCKDIEKYLINKHTPNNLGIYITTAVTIIGGAVSAYYKIRADREYAEYQKTGSTETISRVRRYDKTAGISLAFCQVGIIGLSYLFFLR